MQEDSSPDSPQDTLFERRGGQTLFQLTAQANSDEYLRTSKQKSDTRPRGCL